MKRIMILLLECIFVLGLFSCNVSIEDDDTPDEENVQIILNNSENASFAAVEVGQKNSLRLSNNASAVWTVSGTASATLSASSGTLVYLTAITAGSVTVTAATENGRKYTRELRITAKDTAPNEDNEPNVSFINRSAYRVSVCRDGLTNEIAVVGAGGTKSVYVSPGRGEITFHFRYSYCVIDDADSGTVWMAAADSSVYTYAVDSVDVASGVVPIQIPAPKNPTFRDSYLVVENISEQPVSLYNKNTQHKLYNQEKYYIQPQHSGVYSIQPDAPFEGFSLKSSSAESPVSPFHAESGVVYKCEFDGSGAAAVATEYVRQRELYTVTFEANGGTEISPVETSLLNEPSMPAPEKQGYQFAGWYVDGECRQPVEYPYAVNADTSLYAKWIESGDTAYTVKHYQQNTDFESYTLTKTEPRTGTTGAPTAAAVLSYKGFTARPFEQKPIAADGTTVVEIYYDRSEYTVNHYQQNTDCQTYTLIRTELLTGTLDAPTAAKADVYEGFTARPFGQKPIAENGKTVIDIYYDRNGYTYTVNHYQQNTDCQTYTLAKTETLTGMMGTMTAATTDVYKGFTAKSFEQRLIPANSDTVIDIYYDRNEYTYTVNHYQQNTDCQTYTLAKTETLTGMMGTMTAAKTDVYKGFTAKSFEQKRIPTDSNIVIDIYYDRNECTYTVNHYQQNIDCKTYTLAKTETLTGMMGTMTAATKGTYKGFTAKSFKQKLISADEKTIIDIYYNRNAYTVVFSSNNETRDTATQVFYYGVPQKLNKNTFSYSGYTFSGWGWSETGNIVYVDQAEFCGEYTSNVTLYAKWFHGHGIIATSYTVGNIDLTGITGEYTIKVVGDISQSTLTMLADKMKNKKDILVNLDLSEAVLETIEALDISSSSYPQSIFYRCPLYSIVLPETLKTIEPRALSHCDTLTSVEITGVETIGEWAFFSCDNLESVKIDGAETVGSCAFNSCGNLKTVVLKNITTIGSSVFSSCKSLSSIAIDAETIGNDAFQFCTSLTSVIIGKNVRVLGKGFNCFGGCTVLTSVQFEDTENWYASSVLLDVTDAAENARLLKDNLERAWVKK